MSSHYDVIVVGGGIVGATLAVALTQQSSIKVALIEARQFTPISADDKPELRVSAITRASQILLMNLNIWPRLLSSRMSPFTDMKVWETATSALHFDSADIGDALLGHIIENRHLQQACLARCGQIMNIDLLCPIKPISRTGNTLVLEDGRVLTADLIVAAEGAQSSLREWSGIKNQGWDYKQTAVVCTVTTEYSHNKTARQRFLPEGPLAFLPLVDPHQCSIVWSNSTEEAELLCQLGDERFKQLLGNAFESKLGEIIDVSRRVSFPLKLRHANQYVDTGFALVGDAAHTIHPLAGQGVNIGLLDAATLAEIVMDAHNKRRNIGSLHTLNKYQRRRKADNLLIQLTMDVFSRVFDSELMPIKWARRLGLQTVNKHDVLKRLFIRQAAGNRFSNPTLTKHSIYLRHND